MSDTDRESEDDGSREAGGDQSREAGGDQSRESDSDRSREAGGDQSRGPDGETLREMRERVDELDELVAELRTLGEEADVPAVERTAKRIEGTLAGLDQHLPPELVDGAESDD